MKKSIKRAITNQKIANLVVKNTSNCMSGGEYFEQKKLPGATGRTCS